MVDQSLKFDFSTLGTSTASILIWYQKSYNRQLPTINTNLTFKLPNDFVIPQVLTKAQIEEI